MSTDLRTLIGYSRQERNNPPLASMQGDYPVLTRKTTAFHYEFVLGGDDNRITVLSLRKDQIEEPDMAITSVMIRQGKTGTLIEPLKGKGTGETFLFPLGERDTGAYRFEKPHDGDTYTALDHTKRFRIVYAFSRGSQNFVVLDTVSVGVVLKEIVSTESFMVSMEHLGENPGDSLFAIDIDFSGRISEIVIPIKPE